MYYVYLLQSLHRPGQSYIGSTANLRQRLTEQNEGKSGHTAHHRPWKLVTYIAFSDEAKAREFERYLKVGAGHAFARRHLW